MKELNRGEMDATARDVKFLDDLRRDVGSNRKVKRGWQPRSSVPETPVTVRRVGGVVFYAPARA